MFRTAHRILCLALPAVPVLGGVPLNAALLHVARSLRRTRGTGVQDEVDDALLPKVALVGRPNVGKSALFNRLLRRRAALVYDTPHSHVTRDYQEGRAQLGDLIFRAADTSGLEPRTASGSINARATALTAKLLRQCHLTLIVVDARSGVLPADEELAEWLARHVPREQVMLVANKAESSKAREEMPQTEYDCYRMGFGEPVAVSATTGEGLSDLYTALQPIIDRIRTQLEAAAGLSAGEQSTGERGLGQEGEAVVEDSDGSSGSQRKRQRTLFGERSGVEAQSEGAVPVVTRGLEEEGELEEGEEGGMSSLGVMKLAIMGLPNAGKSTLLNRLLGEERALTGPEAGLTRDAVRAAWMYRDMPVELIDTAGWIGFGTTDGHDDAGGEVAAMSRRATLKSLAQVHVAVLVVDAEKALKTGKVLSRREVALAGTILREGKALLVAANKADILTPQQRALYVKSLRQNLSERFLEAGEVPVLMLSARQGQGVAELMPTAAALYQAWNKRVSTSRLMRFIRRLSVRLVGSGQEAAAARIKFIMQVKARPPTFAVFLSGNSKSPPDRNFATFLAAQIREVMDFQGVPMRVWFRFKSTMADYRKRLQTRTLQRRLRPGAAAAAAEEGRAYAASFVQEAMQRAEELRRDDEDEEEEEDVGDKEFYERINETRSSSSFEAGAAAGKEGEEEEEDGLELRSGRSRGAACYRPKLLRRVVASRRDGDGEEEGRTVAQAGEQLEVGRSRAARRAGGQEEVDKVEGTRGQLENGGSGGSLARVLGTGGGVGTSAARASGRAAGRGVPRLHQLDEEEEEEWAWEGGLAGAAAAGGSVRRVRQGNGSHPGVGMMGSGGGEERSSRGRREGEAAAGSHHPYRRRDDDESAADLYGKRSRTGASGDDTAAFWRGGGGKVGKRSAALDGWGSDDEDDVISSRSRDRVGSGRGGGGGSSKRVLMHRALLLSRKPSAPLQPLQPVTRSQQKARGGRGRVGTQPRGEGRFEP